MSDLRYKKLIYFILGISILIGQEISTSAPLDKEGQIFDLNQKMSISMIDSDIKSVLMLIGELTNVNVVV
ncbi:MAG: hypothetical protein ACJZ1Q_04310, partial [Candidatus Neomarinimicrobiota bacterium]